LVIIFKLSEWPLLRQSYIIIPYSIWHISSPSKLTITEGPLEHDLFQGWRPFILQRWRLFNLLERWLLMAWLLVSTIFMAIVYFTSIWTAAPSIIL
jgi:hypothetical protein